MRPSAFTAIRRAVAIGLGAALPALPAGPAGAVAAARPQYGHDPAHTFTVGDAGGITADTVGPWCRDGRRGCPHPRRRASRAAGCS
jgi:hypothetical protein